MTAVTFSVPFESLSPLLLYNNTLCALSLGADLLYSHDQDEYGYKYPCVKARGIIDGSAAEVMGMIVDSTRVLEYNRWEE